MESIAVKTIEAKRYDLEQLCKEIWDNPEIAFEEYETSRLLADFLKKEGFQVEVGVAGLKTAVRAEWGTGSPAIGFLGELDALPGLSQKISTEKEAVIEKGNGHGCGHNLVAAGHLAAVIGLREQMQREKLPGRIIYFGCPGEEAGTGKIYMAKEKTFDDIDCFIHFHPGQMNMIGISAISSCSAKFDFFGKTAHPSINPQDGRNALEGVELMNIGVNYLRAHVEKDVSMSYIITDGGQAANIIPEYASVLYDLRSQHRETVYALYQRIKEIAEGAAMISGTKVKSELLGCTYDLNNNNVLMEVLENCFAKIKQEPYTYEEISLMKALNEDNRIYTEEMKRKLKADIGEEIHSGMEPMQVNFGSTDVGDISYIAPCVTFRTACYPFGVEGHTWKSTVCSGHTIGMKGMIRAAKIMAEFGLSILKEPEIIEKAKKEFEETTKGKRYISSI